MDLATVGPLGLALFASWIWRKKLTRESRHSADTTDSSKCLLNVFPFRKYGTVARRYLDSPLSRHIVGFHHENKQRIGQAHSSLKLALHRHRESRDYFQARNVGAPYEWRTYQWKGRRRSNRHARQRQRAPPCERKDTLDALRQQRIQCIRSFHSTATRNEDSFTRY